MKDDQEDAFGRLSTQLSRNIDFVKFAETKNAALLTFSSAWIIGSINLLTGQSTLPLGYNVAFCVGPDLSVFFHSFRRFSPAASDHVGELFKALDNKRARTLRFSGVFIIVA
ncbi:hypothetical protein [Bradyrhizobium zhanjiangense]|uniref:hypothetical protein n=1 Tax=Bradyrhizobium zhanjiangense TaxID=1325107 RepID=UPI001008BA5C|nr:hypothetical protein [Bradyrhizobium zhanjiangense]